MGLTRFVPPQRVDLPHEPGAWVEIRKLNGRQLHRVRKAAQSEVFQMAREVGPEMMSSLRSIDADSAEAAMKVAQRNPLQGYDVDLLLEMSVTGWSYDIAVTVDAVEDLDEDTRECVALAAVAFSARQRTEIETKND